MSSTSSKALLGKLMWYFMMLQMCEVVRLYSDKQKCQGIFNKTLSEMLTYVLRKIPFKKMQNKCYAFCVILGRDMICFGYITKETVFQFHIIPQNSQC